MPNRCKKVKKVSKEVLKSKDQFGQSYSMNLDRGEPDIKSYMGSFCSILLFAIVLIYAYQKTEILIDKKNINIIQRVNENALDSDFHFTYRNGFNVAAGLTKYNNNTEM